MQNFWNSKRPYQIAEQVTKGHELACDLVAHVYTLIHDHENIRSLPDYFAKYCYQQWYWGESDFNLLHRPSYTTEIIEEITTEDNPVIEQPEYQQFFREYLNRRTTKPEEWFKVQIVKMVLQGKTRRQIAKETTINVSYIQQTITQFKNDVLDSFNECRNRSDRK